MPKRRKSGPAVLRRGASRPNYYPQDGRAFFGDTEMSKNAVGRFVVVATDAGDVGGKLAGQVVGTFDTQEAAERWLIEDTAAAVVGSGEFVTPGEQRDWGAVHVVCEVKRVVKPVPVVKVEAVLADV